MAQNNRKARQSYIRTLIDSGIDISTIKHHEIAEMFGCSESVVKTDITNYTSNQGQTLIYALCDPDTGKVRYIGQTACKLQTRVVGHVRDALNGRETNVAKKEWLKSLSASRKTPLANILERCKPEMANERERWWIERCQDEGASLLNIMHNGFTISDGDTLYVARQDKDGNGVLPGELWRVHEITRTHVLFKSSTGDTVRLLR